MQSSPFLVCLLLLLLPVPEGGFQPLPLLQDLLFFCGTEDHQDRLKLGTLLAVEYAA